MHTKTIHSLTFTIMFVLTATCVSIAQITPAGIRVGFDMIPTSSNDQTHSGSLPLGFHGGVRAQLVIAPRITLNPEVEYNWMKYDSHTRTPDDAFVNGIAMTYNISTTQARQMITSYWQRTVTTTSYIYIPLLLTLHAPSSFNLSAGPVLGFTLNNKDETTLNAVVANQPVNDQSTETSLAGLRKNNWALAVGVSRRLLPVMRAEIRYTRGITTLEANGSGTKSYYNFIQFSIIYSLKRF